jgi:carbon-monoxide dehydrogenase medium subunit
VKPAPFTYHRAEGVEQAISLLAGLGDEAKILAGGQSLVPMMNLRLVRPAALIDLNGVPGLDHVTPGASGGLTIGALVRHSALASSAPVIERVPLLAEAARHVGHPAIRHRGTLGGSLALADPAAEYPACAVALGAALIVSGTSGERKVSAEKFFKGLFETDLKTGEILVAVEFPVAGKSDRSVFLELTRRQGDYAIIGLAAHNSKFVFLGAGSTPILIQGNSIEKAKAALSKTLNPSPDLYNSSATKLHLAGILLERAWNRLST